MRGLILKDSFCIIRQLKFVIVFILVFSAIPNFPGATFAVFYSVILSFTSMAYDEQSKWDSFAITMPYSVSDIVKSKYVFGIICICIASVFSIIIQILSLLYTKKTIGIDIFYTTGFSLVYALIFQALLLPMIFKMGVAKGRIVFLVCFFAVMGLLGGVSEHISSIVKNLYYNTFNILSISFIVMIVLNILSYMISLKAYESRNIL